MYLPWAIGFFTEDLGAVFVETYVVTNCTDLSWNLYAYDLEIWKGGGESCEIDRLQVPPQISFLLAATEVWWEARWNVWHCGWFWAIWSRTFLQDYEACMCYIIINKHPICPTFVSFLFLSTEILHCNDFFVNKNTGGVQGRKQVQNKGPCLYIIHLFISDHSVGMDLLVQTCLFSQGHQDFFKDNKIYSASSVVQTK